MRFRSQFDEKYDASVFFTEPGEDENLVQQHMRDECDVNVIMKRYQATGELTHVAKIAGEYGDFSDVLDYQDGLNRIMAAESLFLQIPSSIRDEFKNDPGAFVEFASNPDNIDKLREWKLAPPKVVENTAAAPPPSQSPEGAPSSKAAATPSSAA